jgi:hypothetical protein
MNESEDSMTEIGFAPKEIVPQEVCRLEVMAADKAETYGPQIYLKLKIVGGEHDGHQFNDYSNRDEDTGQIKQGSKAWSIFEACLGQDFHKRPGISLESLIGKQFTAQVTQTRTGSRNKVEHGTVGPVSSRATEEIKTTSKPNNGDDEDDTFEDLPF